MISKVKPKNDMRTVLTSAASMMSIVVGLVAALGWLMFTNFTAANADEVSRDNVTRIVEIEKVITIIPIIQDDIDELQKSVREIHDSQIRSEVQTSQFISRQEAMAKRQLDLIERYMKNTSE